MLHPGQDPCSLFRTEAENLCGLFQIFLPVAARIQGCHDIICKTSLFFFQVQAAELFLHGFLQSHVLLMGIFDRIGQRIIIGCRFPFLDPAKIRTLFLPGTAGSLFRKFQDRVFLYSFGEIVFQFLPIHLQQLHLLHQAGV